MLFADTSTLLLMPVAYVALHVHRPSNSIENRLASVVVVDVVVANDVFASLLRIGCEIFASVLLFAIDDRLDGATAGCADSSSTGSNDSVAVAVDVAELVCDPVVSVGV
mmetsp:Transcript_1850/g.3492  ORF Transcript_1850/g.3492 Transcript_1850/m.3492 type:complete len:109 (-) Transcript_1850:253-579(-)